MKQAEDKYTIDMYGEETPPPASTPTPTKHTFYIETTSGERVEWRGLTLKQARDMHAYTGKHMPDNVKLCRWVEQK
jgi:hypothetical protein